MPIAERDRDRIVQAIRTYIAKERISRDEFAQRAKLGKSTVDKLVVGIFSEKTILQIESLLKINLIDGAAADEMAAEELGGYSRGGTLNHYVGEYVFARPSFQEDGLIQAFQHGDRVGPRGQSADGQGGRQRQEGAAAIRQGLHPARVHAPLHPVQRAGMAEDRHPLADRRLQAHERHHADHGPRLRQFLHAGGDARHHEQVRQDRQGHGRQDRPDARACTRSTIRTCYRSSRINMPSGSASRRSRLPTASAAVRYSTTLPCAVRSSGQVHLSPSRSSFASWQVFSSVRHRLPYRVSCGGSWPRCLGGGPPNGRSSTWRPGGGGSPNGRSLSAAKPEATKAPGRTIATSAISNVALIECPGAEPPARVDFTAAAPPTAKRKCGLR